MSFVYIKSEPELWTVGHYRPDGKFEPESDHGVEEDAAKRVRFLNGGSFPQEEPPLTADSIPLRDYFAAHAMPIAYDKLADTFKNWDTTLDDKHLEKFRAKLREMVAKGAYRIADAMLKERSK